MVIANNLDTAERIVLPHNQPQYKWYDYAVFYGLGSVIGAGLFWLVCVIVIGLFG